LFWLFWRAALAHYKDRHRVALLQEEKVMRKVSGFVFGVIMVLVFGVVPAAAQQDTGTIRGTVTDPTGAVIPNARVSVRNVGTGYERTSSTAAGGDYVFTPLPVGTYELRVENKGFQTQLRSKITLQVQENLEINVQLQLGQSNQVVEVTSGAPQLQTTDSSLGTVTNTQYVNELPLNGRNIYQLVALSPGAVTAADGNPSIGGQIDQRQTYVLDGFSNFNYQGSVNSGGIWNIQPSPDAVQEFKVQTNNYSAEFGLGVGVVNVVTKSGTNQLHGSLYEFVRNKSFDATEFFINAANQSKPRYSQNQFGGSLGGPIKKDKTFFFMDYEGFRSRKGTTENDTLPSLAWRQGDFSDLLTGQTFTDPCTGAVYDTGQIFDSTTTKAVTCQDGSTGFARTPISYNGRPDVMNPAQIIAPAANTIALLPTPNVGDPFRYIWSPSLRNDFNQFDINIDHQLREQDRLSIKYSFRDVPPGGIPDFPGPAGQGDFVRNRQQRASISDTHVFSPTVVNELRVGYFRNGYKSSLVNSSTDPASLGFQNAFYEKGIVGGIPSISIAGIAAIGASSWTPTITTARNEMLLDTLSLVRGKHSFKIGGSFSSWWTTQFEPAQSQSGAYGFTGILTADLNAPASVVTAATPAAIGSGFAQFLYGIPDNSGVSDSIFSDTGRKVGAAFIQDDWKVTRKLTVNLGLRWDFGDSVHERFDRVTDIDFTNGSYILPSSRKNKPPFLPTGFPVEYSPSHSLLLADNRNFGPRIGFAYELTPKTVLRSAFGWLYMNPDETTTTIGMPLNPPWASIVTLYDPKTGPVDPVTGQVVIPVTNMATGFPPSVFTDPSLVSQSLLFVYDPHIKTPYVLSWNATIQRQFGFNTTLEVAYTGNAGRHLWTSMDVNQPYPTANPNSPIQSRRPYPNLGSADNESTQAYSTYHALEVKLEKRYSRGLTFLAGYTWAHALDDDSNAVLLANSGPSSFDDTRNARDVRADYGNSAFNPHQRFTLSLMYDLPLGHGREFGNGWSRPLDSVLGGWQIAEITAIQSGFWFTPGTYIDPASAPFYFDPARPNMVANPKNFSYNTAAEAALGCPTGRQSLECFFNPGAFTYADPGTFGNAGRNVVESPGFSGVDFALHKDFRLTESKRLEFRVEAFNIINTPNFRFPDIGYEDSTFAHILSTDGKPRDIQFAFKLLF
jgi:hypothetical protein